MKVSDSGWAQVDETVQDALGRVFPAAVLWVQQAGEVVCQRAYGEVLCSAADGAWQPCPTQVDTVFDLASVTKLFAATAFMTLVEDGLVELDQPVSDVWPAFRGARPIRPYPDPLSPGAEVAVVPPTNEMVDAGRVTFRHLLTHTSGLPAWLPLFELGSRERAVEAVLSTDFAYPTGARVVYSDLGFILLGETLSHLAGQPLPAALGERVLQPLSLSSTFYLPPSPFHSPPSSLAPTEVCAWRQRRLIGEVDDENAAGMGGVAGHAGLFSTARNVAWLGEVYLRGGWELLHSETVTEMTRCQAEDEAVRRGLGWQLWSPDETSSGHPFSRRAYGHTGFTGTSLWVDPEQALVVVCLTNRVYYGRRQGEGIAKFRLALHEAIVAAQTGGGGSCTAAECTAAECTSSD